MDNTFANRVRTFRESKGLSQAAFAERCDLAQGNVSQMEKGTEPKQSNVSKILLGFPDLNPDWLLTGNGSMLRDGRALSPLTLADVRNAAPLGLFEDMDATAPRVNPPAAGPANTHAAGLLAQLQEENERLRERLRERELRAAALDTALSECMQAHRTSQEHISLLLGKSQGSQHAPGAYAHAA